MMTATVSFEEIGHKPVDHHVPLFNSTVRVCSVCHCWEGSEIGMNPCGDPWGREVKRERAIVDGQFGYEFRWRGKLIRKVTLT